MTDNVADDLHGWDRQTITQIVHEIKHAGHEPAEPYRTAWRILERLVNTPARNRWLAESRLATLAGPEPGQLAGALHLLTVEIANRPGISASFVEVEEREGERRYALRERVAPIVGAALGLTTLDAD